MADAITRFCELAGSELTLALIAALGAKAPAPAPAPAPEPATGLVTVKIPFGPWHKQDGSSPWAAIVAEWNEGQYPKYVFLNYAWNGHYTSGGELRINAHAGDLLRIGQKFHRNRETVLRWLRVNADGTVTDLTPVEARKAWLESQKET